jgi:hypothetical protein
MSASDALSTSVVRLQTVPPLNNTKAWGEVEKIAEKVALDALAREKKAAAFQPMFTNGSACNEIIRCVALDYERVGVQGALKVLSITCSDISRSEYREISRPPPKDRSL